MSQFVFLRREWPDVFDVAARAESPVHRDARASGFYARRALELAGNTLILANPPFAGSLDLRTRQEDLLPIVETKKTDAKSLLRYKPIVRTTARLV